MAAERRRSSAAAGSSSRLVDAVLLVIVAAAACWIHGGLLPMAEGKGSPFSALIMVGDSTIDVGTNNRLLTLIKSDFEPYGRDMSVQLPKGRFSNGLLTPDYIAEEFGFPYQVAYLERAGHEDLLLTGVNFASSGSGWLNLTADAYNVISFSKQLGQLRDYKDELTGMLGKKKAEYIISNALYIISTGANDYVLSYYLNPILQDKYTLSEYQQQIREASTVHLKEMYRIGARNVVVTSTPPIGCLPAAISIYGYKGLGKDGCVSTLNEAATVYNVETEQEALPKFRAEYPDAKFYYFDIYNYLYDVATHPQAYGYKESRRACCGTGLLEVSILCNAASVGTCDNANDYVFFDSFHPTTRVYKGLKDHILPLLKAAYKIP